MRFETVKMKCGGVSPGQMFKCIDDPMRTNAIYLKIEGSLGQSGKMRTNVVNTTSWLAGFVDEEKEVEIIDPANKIIEAMARQDFADFEQGMFNEWLADSESGISDEQIQTKVKQLFGLVSF